MNTRLVYTLFFLLPLLHAAGADEYTFSFRSLYSNSKTVLSLSYSLLTRVSNLRAERGDVAGAARAKLLAQKLERGMGLGFAGMAWSLGGDYLRNYAWRGMDYKQLHGVVSDLSELLGFVGEWSRARSDERSLWIARNYQSLLRVAKSVLNKLVEVFHASGPVKEVVETVQMEVAKGGLLMDCLEVGGNDLKGLVQIVKDWLNSHSDSSSNSRAEL